METSKIREYSNEELTLMLADEEKALKTLKYNSFINKVENPSKIKVMRKTIARMKTIMHERFLASVQQEVNKI